MIVRTAWTLAVLAGVCSPAMGQPLGQNSTIQTAAVLISGVEYPGIGRVRNVLSIDVNDACWVSARAEVIAPNSDNRREVLLAGQHGMNFVPVAVGGELMRGTTLRASVGSAFSLFQIGRAGETSYQANLTDAGGLSRPTLMWVPGPGSNHIVLARVGGQVPGEAAGVVYAGFFPHAQGNGGVACYASIAGPGVTPESDTVLITSSGPSVQVLREGVAIASLGGRAITLDAQSTFPTAWFGPVLFRGGLPSAPGGPPVQTLMGAYPAQLLVQAGWSAPGLPGVTFRALGAYPSIGYAAEVGFGATLAGQGVTQLNESSLWLRGVGLVARGAQPAPGLDAGIRYLAFGSPVIYGRDRGVLFAASLLGERVNASNNTALFAGPVGASRLVARMGDPAPGTPAGVVLGGFEVQSDQTPIFVNARGDVVFVNRLRGEGVSAANDLAIFVREAGGDLRLVAREGNAIVVNGASRTIGELAVLTQNRESGPALTNGDDGRRTLLNKHGECFFVARFVDGGVALMKAQAGRLPCEADFNEDRFVDCFDYLLYVQAFESGEPDADLNSDAFVDFFDYARFVEVFEEGC
jgi:hypothetical protein